MNLKNISLLCKVGLLCTALTVMADTTSLLPDISKGWKFKTGDDSSWSDPLLNDSDWRHIRVGNSWEKQGLPDQDGYAWYRLHVRLPGSIKNHLEFEPHRSIRITLGKIDDVDQAWFNGKVIGNTGAFPVPYNPAWQSTRVYLIPSSLIRWDEDNVIAVRVYDGNGEGGMYEGPYRLEMATLADFLKVDFHLGQGDGIFVEQEEIPIAVSLHNDSELTASGDVNWTVEDDEGTTLSESSSIARIPERGEERVEHKFTPVGPGFYRVKWSLRSQESDITKSSSVILGYRPEDMHSALTREDDFDEFWRNTLDELVACEPRFEMIRKPTMDSETHIVYEVKMWSLGGVRVRGWYEQPKAADAHPALLRVPGYGENMQPTGSSDAMAIFSFNIRGHGNSQEDIKGTPQDYWIRGLDDKEGYYYQGAYADCVRAVDFLASRPEVDKRRIAVTGGSQGGGLSLATAALDSRISLCAPDIPFLCDWKKYFRASHWPEMDAWVKEEPHRTWETTLQTMSYFDTINLADRIKCPVFMGIGLQDDVCPPATIFAVYNLLPGRKTYRLYPHAGHWVGASHHEERRNWILRNFGVGE